MEITASMVKELRDKTNAGFIDCKNALKESAGDIEKAISLLRKRGQAVALKKAGRETKAGLVDCYIHAGSRLGVLVEVDCETDFVAKNEIFQQFVKDVAMHIAAANPVCIKREEVPADLVEKEKDIFMEQVKGKPENVVEKILEGKLDKFYSEICLIDQTFVKDNTKKISDLLTDMIHQLGENIIIKKFTRFEVGVE